MDEQARASAQFPDGHEPHGSPADGGPDQACERVPEEWEVEGPAVSISLGDAADLDPVLLAAMTGPDGLGGEALGAQFGQDRAADALRPGPVLAALTEQAVADAATLTDDQLMGALQAARRIQNRAAWQQTMVTAEFARRRQAQHEDAKARKVPPGCRPGEFPSDELAVELLITRRQAENRIDADLHLTGRLPATLAGMAAGVISADQADVIASYTAMLSEADTAYADQVLAAAAPGLRYDQLARKAAALEMKLDPQAAAARKEMARRTRQRVEAGREPSGNAYLAGRELATADVMASKAYIDAVAVRLRRAGLNGNLDQLRALALTDLTQGRDPLDRITGAPATGPDPTPHSGPAGPAPAPAPDPALDPALDPDPAPAPALDPAPAPAPDLDFDPDPDPGLAPPPAPGPPAPLPALINLIVPIGTYLGWSTAPAQAGSWGLLDPDDTRDIAQAASRHPRTRWGVIVVGPDGTAIAHGRSPGQHPQPPPGPGTPVPGTPVPGTPPSQAPGRSRGDPGPSPAQATRLRELLRQLNVIPEPIARGTCDHRHAEDHYAPSRTLQQLVRARTATCTAPGCNSQAVHSDIDHTTPYPNGPTCECNLAPACRRHHRCKQAPDWQAAQPQPGIMRWTTPAGRTYTTTPTVYDT